MAISTTLALSPEHGYHVDVRPPQDTDISSDKRDRGSRILVLLLGLGIMILGPVSLCRMWGIMLHLPGTGLLLGIAAAAITCATLLPKFFITNDEWYGNVTQDMLGGSMVPYGPGMHPAYPWESRDKSHNYSLEIIPDKTVVSIQTLTAKVTVRITYEFARDLANLDISIGSSHGATKDSLTAFVSSFLTNKLSGWTADKSIRSVEKLNTCLATEFMRSDSGVPGQFEAKSGFRIVTVVIASVDLPEAVEKARDAIDQSEALHKAVAASFGMKPEDMATKVLDGSISHDQYIQMLNRAMAVSQNLKIEIKGWEVNLPKPVIDMLERLAGSFKK